MPVGDLRAWYPEGNERVGERAIGVDECAVEVADREMRPHRSHPGERTTGSVT